MADAIINSGPPSTDANPIQIRGGDDLTSPPCSGNGAGSGARSYRSSTPEYGELDGVTGSSGAFVA